MRCPFCGSDSTKVIDSRSIESGHAIRRRRACEECGERFSTQERPEEPDVTVVKRDGRRERFDRQKLLRGLVRAAGGRPVDGDQLELLVSSIAADLRRGGSEVEARQVGDMAERGLARLDPVAAIQFASVYRSLRDLDELAEVVSRYQRDLLPGDDQLPLEGVADPSEPGLTIARPPVAGAEPSTESRSQHA